MWCGVGEGMLEDAEAERDKLGVDDSVAEVLRIGFGRGEMGEVEELVEVR